MLFVFPQNMGRGGFSDNAAENTIHLNHRQFHHGLGLVDHLKPGLGGRQSKWAFSRTSQVGYGSKPCSDSVAKTGPSRMFR
ncbi:hypothetical protein [Pseudomonas veronii]|uniref:hypothetical protein n=1 Tax=Pseudomonas veronii TaxID=76761 RepID=UPI0015A37F5B|nr:hypothetical protein [Pseudomonas veronii]NWC58594.1 hypothetical protein [Pseudomonas veronii]NWD54372.1 hypothetical protein [Pseudomonas veronii]